MKKMGKRISKETAGTEARLRLPALDQARVAMLDSLGSRESQRGYKHTIDEFIQWDCSAPRPSFNKAVVTQ